ncbi:hypothetical protein L249_4631 [Ophiocordyceps polyrhachis-furcata BCC 54312]|uniref:STAS domain-containing protein n=1 Tax=Ophiocordyceps polyrhachis-furcata BCC 54312 TaxID=1330021 RepID=A0A367L330_9HYPO|nr:hypothetical protein L249_4631 [Ophiocordyceps polyrhachis-furcata BCC 54312]
MIKFKTRLADAIGLTAARRGDHVLVNAHVYVDGDPSVGDFVAELVPSARDLAHYFTGLFPFVHWIGKYNLAWLFGDVIAGVTVGAVVVPQGMAYAQLAQLPVEYGLYTSFMGVVVYWAFATSKDITIGPVAVMSLVTGNVVLRAREEIPDVDGHVVASALALVTGAIILFLGLARLGWLVEFIPLPAICAFMTGSALNIASGQLPKLMGVQGVDIRDATYRVVIDTLRNLPTARLDAAIGLSALFMLYSIRFFCSRLAKCRPRRAKLFFFLSTLRTVFVILLYTGISAAVNARHRDKPRFSIIKDVPRGFQHAAVPEINPAILSTMASEIPAAVVVMLIEHISISKSFGRINNYVINPSQELVAIGVSNVLGPFLGAYPATGSFSRTAIKSKAGVRTPFAGVITAMVVLLALYALTGVFFYIPSSALAAVIIHAVCDVITPPAVVVQFWRVSPLEAVIFAAGVLAAVFSTIEMGIYVAVGISFAILVWRLFLSSGRVLGIVRVRTAMVVPGSSGTKAGDGQEEAVVDESDLSLRTGFLPLGHEDGSNPSVALRSPHPGIFIYGFAEGFNYPNASRSLGQLTDIIFRETRRTDVSTLGSLKVDDEDERPTLKAVILDFSSVNNIDVTATQALIDVRNQLDSYAAPDRVDWHFAHIRSRWTKRSLAAAGFGYRTPRADPEARWKTIFSIADDSDAETEPRRLVDVEGGGEAGAGGGGGKDGLASLVAVQGLNRPLFHLDLQEAVEAALLNE